jgi:hypothetical protein
MKNCKQCREGFEVRDADREFYSNIGVPEPTLCPLCRVRRRLVWRNERKLYRRKCDATGADIISNISSDKPFPVFEKSYWFSDKHNPLDFGRDFDFSRPFFEQFAELQAVAPRFSIQQQEPMENSEFCNFAWNCKNSYFLFDSNSCEDSYYSNFLKSAKDCCDCSFTSHSELCYETINCKNCYNLKFSKNCINCSDSMFLANCIGCSNCAFSFNLRNKKYHFANREYSKEEYEKKISDYRMNEYRNLQKYKEFFKEQFVKAGHKFYQGTQNENISGDYIQNSKNVFRSFYIEECWDVAYCDKLFYAKDCQDVSSFGEKIDFIYDCATVGINTQNCKFCFTAVMSSNDLLYCDTAYSSQNCFGCVGLNRNKYCVLNKQYTQEEYEELLPKIIDHMKSTGEWGEFFPVQLSPFAYNETVAFEYFPLKKEDVLKEGWKWKDEDNRIPEVKKIIPAKDLPDRIEDVPDEVLDFAIECEETKKPFKLQKNELRFYRRTGLPAPHFHPDVRHQKRQEAMHGYKLYERKCFGCEKTVETSYSQDAPQKIYCEDCYSKEFF